MKVNILIIYLNLSLLLGNVVNNYNSIYSLAKDPKSHSLGGIHTKSSSINGVFYLPFSKKNIEGDTYFSYLNQFDNSINIVQFGYCILHDEDKNISIGLINRRINNVYNTTSAWNPLNPSDEPSFSSIDYSDIQNLKYQNIGFSISYNKFLNKSIINVKIKPYYEFIESISSTGIDIDLMFLKEFKTISVIAGVNDLFSYKKWNTGVVEHNKLNYFFSTSVYVNNIGLFIEANSLYNEKFGFEYNYNNIIYFRLATNVEENLFYGLAFNLNAIELSYAYIPMNEIIGDVTQLNLTFKLSGLKQLKEKLKP